MLPIERARAKVNLTLRVLGRRPDGYHELESLVAFADFADKVDIDPNDHYTLRSVGTEPPPTSLQDNSVTKAVRLVAEALGDPGHFYVCVHKRIPAAAGLGGGSADAGAALRLLRMHYGARGASLDWLALARRLGADVPVCLLDSAAMMRGTGEILDLVPDLPEQPAILVNPRCLVPGNKTAAVFGQLRAAPLPPCFRQSRGRPKDLAAFIASGRNDLEAPSIAVMPEIRDVLDAIRATDQNSVARLSGAGPTCFGLYPSAGAATAAAKAIKAAHPAWLAVATTLR